MRKTALSPSRQARILEQLAELEFAAANRLFEEMLVTRDSRQLARLADSLAATTESICRTLRQRHELGAAASAAGSEQAAGTARAGPLH